MVFLWSLVFGVWCFSSRAAFVHETPAEFLTAGDFNGDGLPDALVLDKLTGNARVGYQSPAGELTWSTALVTGVENVTGCGVGHLLGSDRDTLAVTSPGFNRLNYVDLSATNSASTVFDIAPGIGPHTLAALAMPFVPPSSSSDHLLVASSFNNAPAERLHVKLYFSGASASASEFGSFERPNALQLATNEPTFAVGLVRGLTNDTLRLWQFTNSGSPSVIGALSNLPPGSDYAFGKFNDEPLPRFWFYVPGETNVSIRSLVTNGAGFAFSSETTLDFTQAVERVYVVGTGDDGSAILQFGDGIQGARLPGGTPSLAAKFSTGSGASGNVTGVVPLTDGKFVLLAAPTGTVSSLTARVLTFDGTNYTLVSSNNLSALTRRESRANVWLFQTEPLVTPNATFIASVNAPDWSSGVTGLPASLNARVETDGGTTSGLGSPATNNLGSAPAGANFALADQYRDDISFFSYAAPRQPDFVTVTISPPPGAYGGPISLSFATLNMQHQVFYRVAGAGAWQQYTAPFALTNDATIEYYGRQPSTGFRAQLQSATYTLGNIVVPPEPPVTLPGSATNPPPTLNTNITRISANGTVIYGRRSPLGTLKGLLGPAPYLSFADSPFTRTNGLAYFHLEDFEDGALNTPGGIPSAGWLVVGPGGVDSVDPGGRSYYSNGRTNLTITFDAAALGGKLPTHAGIVWTDVGSVSGGPFGFGNVRFTARDANGVTLGTNVAASLGNGSSVPSQAEDRFFGVVNAGGISSISITTINSGDWEVDHLQYGRLDAAGFSGSIWAIHLDGSSDTPITTGLRPRVSRDGHFMSFLRENDPATNQFSLWVRDLATGQEVRLHGSSNRYVGHDWSPGNTNLVFDNDCFLWRMGLSGPVEQLPLPADCRQGAPSVNPLDGRLAFQVVFPGSTGLYLAPPDATTRQNLNLSVFSPRWPAWSPDGQRLAIADDPNISPAIDAGHNLWVVHLGAQTNAHQITALAGDAAFPNGAVWTHGGDKLVGAGRLGGTNGLWVIPLTPNRDACGAPPQRLPTSPGDEIDFAGSVVATSVSVSYANLGLFIRLEPSAMVVYWSTNYDGFKLESALELPAGLVWSPVNGPYFRVGPNFEYREPRIALQPTKYFRLHYPGVLILTPEPNPVPPLAPNLMFQIEPDGVVLNWPPDYVGYTLEATTNLSPPILWTPLNGAYLNTNGVFEYRRALPGPPQEFYRLRWP